MLIFLLEFVMYYLIVFNIVLTYYYLLNSRVFYNYNRIFYGYFMLEIFDNKAVGIIKLDNDFCTYYIFIWLMIMNLSSYREILQR
jgi:hypothetical protein